MVIAVGGSLFVSLAACKNSTDEIAIREDAAEQSSNPVVFLAGQYRLDKLDLPSGYGEQIPSLSSQYELIVRAVGDSLQLSLSGSGKAGQYNQLALGTYGVTPSVSNLVTISVGNRYVYKLRRSIGQRSYITFTRIPYPDKTEYSVLFNLYQIEYGLDKNRGAVIADESYSLNPSFNERVATLRLARTSSGVWRAK